MKKGLLALAATLLASLAGCAIVPADYGPAYAPHYGASVVITPSHGHYHYAPRHRYWRGHRH